LTVAHEGNPIPLYVIKSAYENGVHSSNIIEKLGTYDELNMIVLIAFCIYKGNINLTLIPLEKQILSDFKLSRFVVCTDAGLSSSALP